MITSKEYFKGLYIVYLALLVGQIFFILIALFLFYYGLFNAGAADFSEIFIYVVPVFTIAGVFVSNYLYKNRISAIKSKKELPEKLGDFRSIQIIRLALLEGPSFIAIIAFLLTGQMIHLGFAALTILVFLTARPTRMRVISDLELNREEQKLINEPEAFVADKIQQSSGWNK